MYLIVVWITYIPHDDREHVINLIKFAQFLFCVWSFVILPVLEVYFGFNTRLTSAAFNSMFRVVISWDLCPCDVDRLVILLTVGAYQSTYLPYYGHTHYLQSTNQQISPSAVVNQNTQQLAPASQPPLGYYPGIYSPCNQQQTTPAVYNTYEPSEWIPHP